MAETGGSQGAARGGSRRAAPGGRGREGGGFAGPGAAARRSQARCRLPCRAGVGSPSSTMCRQQAFLSSGMNRAEDVGEPGCGCTAWTCVRAPGARGQVRGSNGGCVTLETSSHRGSHHRLEGQRPSPRPRNQAALLYRTHPCGSCKRSCEAPVPTGPE